MTPVDDDDDWVGTPPEGRYTRDRADPGFWARQKPIVPAFVGIVLVVVVILLVVLVGCRDAPRRARRRRSASTALGPGGTRPSVDSHEPAMISSRPAIAPAPGRSPRTATPSATATTGAT